MALMCINGSAQCTGCMMCQEEKPESTWCDNCGKDLVYGMHAIYKLSEDEDAECYCKNCFPRIALERCKVS